MGKSDYVCVRRNVNERIVRKCLFKKKCNVSSTSPPELDCMSGLLFKVHCLFVPSQGTKCVYETCVVFTGLASGSHSRDARRGDMSTRSRHHTGPCRLVACCPNTLLFPTEKQEGENQDSIMRLAKYLSLTRCLSPENVSNSVLTLFLQ